MRLPLTLSILLAGLGISALVWWLSGGRVWFLFFPLIFGLPLLFNRRR